ncbi:butyrate kinase [Salidesulfovibrio onnuriiensis]|uniref:butyrate kinase n=1 Tax=Salidesulfovibrio onnuriiensis TaxID=2583823 RepID=UPI0011CA632C|nr:butyrate kinase [Salidesulfovibrio onnuriiensis]
MSPVFVINPGSTSTKLALYEGSEEIFERELQHSKKELAAFPSVGDQKGFRMDAIRKVLAEEKVDGSAMDAIAGRGGLLAPLQGGTYEVSDRMIDDLLANKYGEHPCNLGAVLARDLAEEWGVPAYIVDPVVTDEMDDRARLTGMPGLERRSVFHALNQRGAARVAAERLGVRYEDSCFIVAHMGGGMSIGAHRRGRVTDVTNGLDGEGPFTPERTGALPVLPVLERMRDGESFDALRLTILREGGVWAHLGTNNMMEVEKRVLEGDEEYARVFRAMVYNVAKHIASMVPAALDGEKDRVDAIVITGGMSRCKPLMEELRRLLKGLGEIVHVPGSVEMGALAKGAFMALAGETPAQRYLG